MGAECFTAPGTFNTAFSSPHVVIVSLPHTFPAMNWVGSLLAIAGTGLYSMAKQKASNDATKAKQA